jgi:prophage maintenance system killer protein
MYVPNIKGNELGGRMLNNNCFYALQASLRMSVSKKHLPNPVNKRLNIATRSSSLYLTFENISLNSLKHQFKANCTANVRGIMALAWQDSKLVQI